MPRMVVLTAECFEKIISFLGQYGNPLLSKNKCVEAFAFLFCRQTPAYYIIEDAVGVATGERASVELKPEELALIEFFGDQHPDLFLGGWAHSHPGWGLFFSETDERNQMFYQQMNEDGLGLVWDFTLVGKKGKGLGFTILRLDDANRHGYHEVTFKLQGFSKPFIERIFSPLGYDKKILAAAWKDVIEGEIPLKPLEESLVKAQRISTDITSMIGGPTPTGESETQATPSAPSNPDANEFPETWDEKVKAQVTLTESRDKATSLKEMGILHFSQQHYVQAAKELKAAIAMDRADTESWAFYYLCIYNEGDRLAANNVFGELGEIIGGDTAKWLEVARLCEERDNFDGATHAYTQVIRRDPMNFSLLDKIKLLSQRKQEREGRI
jgi:tetratricopeptide (TPR) repeat protein